MLEREAHQRGEFLMVGVLVENDWDDDALGGHGRLLRLSSLGDGPDGGCVAGVWSQVRQSAT